MAKRIPWNKGIKYTPEQKAKINTGGLGKNIDFKKRGLSIGKTRKGVPLSEDHKKSLSKSQTKKWTDPEYRAKQQKAMREGNTGGWNRGTGDQEGRTSGRYKTWRLAVLERDNYTCRGCGERDAKMEVHHIKPWSQNKDLRFIVNNGITYCPKCHIENDELRARYSTKGGIQQ